MTTLVQALLGLTDAVSSLSVELRLQRVAIAKLGALRELDKEETTESLDSLGQRVVEQEGKVARLALVPARQPTRMFPPDEPPTRPDGPKPPRPHVPRYPRLP
jgi:hypothetical protein